MFETVLECGYGMVSNSKMSVIITWYVYQILFNSKREPKQKRIAVEIFRIDKEQS